jgi:C-terminal processing protease CtpA/Prc
VITSSLSADLSAAVGEPVLGLLGYSFFKRHRVAVDYPNRTLWLDPDPHARDDHPYEYSHVGIQLERDGEQVRVVGVAAGSPADAAGISVGDTLIAIGPRAARADALLELTDLLEGAPGTRLQVTLLKGGLPHAYRLMRRKLL